MQAVLLDDIQVRSAVCRDQNSNMVEEAMSRWLSLQRGLPEGNFHKKVKPLIVGRFLYYLSKLEGNA